jgi:hypothetical protein
MAAKESPGALVRAAGAGKPVHASAEGPREIARKPRKKKPGIPYRVTPSAGDPFRIEVSGRVRWALDRLRAAGGKGCTPIADPAPRWSAYVHSLREMGVEIETLTEPHGGEFAGHHGRYVLRCRVAPDLGGAA